MDKDTKVLFMAVVIILVALVSFNLTDLTGKTINEPSITIDTGNAYGTVTFTKHQQKAPITVTLSIGKESVKNVMYLYKKGSGKVVTEKISLCRSSMCDQDELKPSYTHYLSNNLEHEGIYYFIARGRDFDDVIATSNTFQVIKT